MTTEWDNTPWAGEPARTSTSPGALEPYRPGKAVTALGPWATGTTLSSLLDTPQKRAATYLRAYRFGWFYKAGSKISDDFARLPWHVSDGDADSDDPDETHLDRPDLDIGFDTLSPIDQLMRLLERPNPYQTGTAFRRQALIRRDFGGAAFIYLAGGRLPSELYGISPARMWPAYSASRALIGWVMDRDSPSGGVPFDRDEIVVWSSGGPDIDPGHPDYPFGASVVEAVQGHTNLSELIARHASDVLATGGRLAGMLWPKDKGVDEDEYQQIVRAWRSVASDPNAARRLLVMPEPMEWAQGAANPSEIGLPELATMTRDEVLTAFPISPSRLGVPHPSGLNAGAEVRREERRDYWEETIGPRVDDWDELVQVALVSRYEQAMGRTFKFGTETPSLDDAPVLLEKVAALRALAEAGFDEKAAVKVVGLEHIKFGGIPAPDPELTTTVNDSTRRDGTQTTVKPAKPDPAKGIKARDDIARAAVLLLADFLDGQRERVVSALRESLPASKSARREAIKADPEWWNAATEDAALTEVLRAVYVEAGRTGLQVVADGLGRIVPNKAVDRIVADLLAYGGERIPDINARTLQAITIELSEGARRGYSVAQLIDGVPDEGFRGVLNVGLDNGVPAWSDIRAETIARTETALSYNRAALRGYGEFGVARVVAIDGDQDAECAARNGAEFALTDALGITDHPQGTLDWSPVV